MINAPTPRRHPRYAVVRGAICALALAGTTAAARGAITEITATLEANVTELIAGQAGSTDSSLESFPSTSPTLPIEALAGLGDFSGELGLESGGRALATFTDPTLPQDPNPREFGCEALAYSLASTTAFESAAEAIELRTVLLSPEEMGVDDEGDERAVVSRAFLEGAILVWTDDAGRNLTGASAEFQFRILHVTTTGIETVVFEAELTVTGAPSGEVQLAQSSVLDAVFGGPEVLAGVGGADTQQAVEALEEIGRVHVVLLPAQSLNYAYLARAGESFTLRAEASCAARNLPAGTGSAAVFGRPFAGLSFALTPFTDQAKAAEIQDLVNQAMRISADENGAVSPLCGAFGLETPFLLFAGLYAHRRHHG